MDIRGGGLERVCYDHMHQFDDRSLIGIRFVSGKLTTSEFEVVIRPSIGTQDRVVPPCKAVIIVQRLLHCGRSRQRAVDLGREDET